ncbi:MAG: histidinol dehydrogenase [Brevinematales bacterium]|nr:histidinol dehydrogenase [Brevinematales bacterium]
MLIRTFEEFKTLTKKQEELNPEIINSTQKIIEDVKKMGDEALLFYSKKFDGVRVEKFNFLATEDEIIKASKEAEEQQGEILKLFLKAAENIKEFHEKQKEESFFYHKDGATLGLKITPISKVLTYVPGGKAFYPSTALMNIIPAKVAGVEEIILTTPPSETGGIKNPLAIAIAHKLGVHKIYKLGGAHAIAGFAYGTETLPRVAKIVGPGNAYVATAKKLLSGVIGIDSIAGPSEVVTFADETANPEWIAIDLCAQAEHTGDNTVILISTSTSFIKEVEKALEKIIKKLKRSELIEKSIKNYSFAIKVKNYQEGFEAINFIAPEHVEVMINLDRFEILQNIKNAGAIFIGNYTPVALGDYFAGPNHVIPTNGTATFSSPLGVYDFVKKSSFLSVTEDYINKNAEIVGKLAYSEELEAHALSVLMRKTKTH